MAEVSDMRRRFGGKVFFLVFRGYRGAKRGKSQAEMLSQSLRSKGYDTRVVKMGLGFDGLRGDYGVYALPAVPLDVKFSVSPLGRSVKR